MKIATWNVFSGNTADRAQELRQFSDVDFIAFQETSRTEDDDKSLWRGDPGRGTKGVSVWSRYAFEIYEPKSHCSPNIAVSMSETPIGPVNILNLWAKPKPDYYQDLMNSLEVYAEFIQQRSTIILGDFNISPKISGTRGKFESFLQHVEKNLNLRSAYHLMHSQEFGKESKPTLYHTWSQERPYHCDFVFVPKDIELKLKSVEVPAYALLPTSDHRPVICELVRNRADKVD